MIMGANETNCISSVITIFSFSDSTIVITVYFITYNNTNIKINYSMKESVKHYNIFNLINL
jgi:hypothetical protein